MKLKNLLIATAGLASVQACDPAESDACADKKAGTICSVVGTRFAGLGDDGLDAHKTDLYLPQDITVHDGKLYVVDWNNHRVRVVENDGTVRTVIGTGYLGDALDPATGNFEGKAAEINLNHPTHVLFADNGDMIISAWHNSQVLRFDPEADKVTRVCGTGARNFNGDDKPPKETFLDLPVSTAWTPEGDLLISDQANQRIRKIVDPDSETATMTTVVGVGTKGYSGDGGPAIEAQIQLPTSQSAPPAGRMVTDSAGRIYLADTVNNVIRKVEVDGIITTIAGTGSPGNGADGVATACALNTPADVAVDQAGNVYIADTMNSCVRKVTPDGQITTAAGTCGTRGFKGDGGPVGKSLLDRPYGVDVDTDGRLFIADTHNHNIRVVYPQD